MADRLIIDSDETVELAHALAGRLGTTPGEAVARALRWFDRRLTADESQAPAASADAAAPRQAAFIADLLARGAVARTELPPGTSCDHSHLYDENGLPL